MSTKSHVGMGYKRCLACGEKFDEVVLLDRRIQDTLERDNVMGHGVCPKCQEICDNGHVILICVKDNSDPNEPILMGKIAIVKREAADDLFNVEIKNIAFVEENVFTKIEAIAKEANEE